MAQLQRHGDLHVAVTEEDRQAGQIQADRWEPPHDEMHPHAMVTIGDPTWPSERDECPQVAVTPADINRLIKESEKKAREHQQGSVPAQYTYHDKTYRNKRKGSGINASYSLEDIEEYLESLPTEQAEPFDPDDEIPFATVGDYVCTLRNATSHTTGSFLWPSTAISFQQAVTTSLATLPPG